jgi:hypothetical protein
VVLPPLIKPCQYLHKVIGSSSRSFLRPLYSNEKGTLTGAFLVAGPGFEPATLGVLTCRAELPELLL